MKQIVAALVALVIATGPVLAQPRPPGPPPHGASKKVIVVPKRHHRGERLAPNLRRSYVTDYRHRGLPAPRPGHRWVRVGNQYLLIAVATGLISSVMVAR